jgi:TPR repeat protein
LKDQVFINNLVKYGCHKRGLLQLVVILCVSFVASAESVRVIFQDLSEHYYRVRLGIIEDWNILKGYADSSMPLAAGFLVVCIHLDKTGIASCDDIVACAYLNRSLPWLTEESERGCKHSQYCLAMVYSLAIYCPQEGIKAILYCRLSADQGYVPAQCLLGYMFSVGNGVATNEEEAVKWFRISADLGFAPAARYYRLAADQGYASAQHSMGIRYRTGSGVEKDEREAIRWTRLSAGQGFTEGIGSLGYCYSLGIGIAKDYIEASCLFQLAANKGSAYAQHSLAVLLLNGQGVPKSSSEAVRYLQLAAAQEYASAQYSLGCRYEAGEGVPFDSRLARHWFEMASVNGHAPAKIKIESMDSISKHGRHLK